jgi:hypothetical protein
MRALKDLKQLSMHLAEVVAEKTCLVDTRQILMT